MRSRSNSGTWRTDLTSRRRKRRTDFVANRASAARAYSLIAIANVATRANCHHSTLPERSDSKTQINAPIAATPLSTLATIAVTNVSTDTLTITRAQEGTSAANHNTGGKTYSLVLGITAKMISDIQLQTGNGIPVENEVVGGSGTSWTLANTPVTGSVKLWAGGIRLTPTLQIRVDQKVHGVELMAFPTHIHL